MIVAVDSSTLILLINPGANPPDDPETRLPVERARERVEHFRASLGPKDTILVAAPVMAEVLVRAEEAAGEILSKVAGEANLRVAPFDLRAAAETALMTREAIAKGHKGGGSGEPWQKVKIDRQIVATARVGRADLIYADDRGLIKFARALGMEAKSTWDLDLPPEPPGDLFSSIPDHTA